MAVTPNTVLKLLKCPLELDNLNQLTFNNANDQFNYFNSLPQIEIDNITYQRKDNVVRFPAHIDTLLEYNYVMYQNSNYSNKWFYAYIDKMEYLNDSTTLITISTDCYQTWMFDINIKRSFVIREHTNNDTIGANTVFEGLEKGDMIEKDYTPITYLRDTIGTGTDAPNKAYIIIGSTRDLTNSSFPLLYGSLIQGLYSGVSYFAFSGLDSVNTMLKAITTAGYIDDIVSMFMAPSDLAKPPATNWTTVTVTGGTYNVHKTTSTDIDYFRTLTYTVPIPTSIDGYTPVNKKLLTGEFNILNMTNYIGGSQMLRYELFNGTNCVFRMRGTLNPGCSIVIYPSNYMKTDSDNSYVAGCYSLVAPKLPVCNWNSDQYTNWLASTSSTRAIKGLGGVASVIGGAVLMATGAGSLAGGGMIAAGIGTIASLGAESADHSKDANANNGDPSSADVLFATSKVFGAYQYCIRNEYAQKIDRIFSAIGYKTMTMKIPNITGRRNWNYVQTQSVSITGDVPQEDLQVIKDMFNNGVTLWHNPATFLDYSQNNGII